MAILPPSDPAACWQIYLRCVTTAPVPATAVKGASNWSFSFFTSSIRATQGASAAVHWATRAILAIPPLASQVATDLGQRAVAGASGVSLPVQRVAKAVPATRATVIAAGDACLAQQDFAGVVAAANWRAITGTGHGSFTEGAKPVTAARTAVRWASRAILSNVATKAVAAGQGWLGEVAARQVSLTEPRVAGAVAAAKPAVALAGSASLPNHYVANAVAARECGNKRLALSAALARTGSANVARRARANAWLRPQANATLPATARLARVALGANLPAWAAALQVNATAADKAFTAALVLTARPSQASVSSPAARVWAIAATAGY